MTPDEARAAGAQAWAALCGSSQYPPEMRKAPAEDIARAFLAPANGTMLQMRTPDPVREAWCEGFNAARQADADA